jgi:L-threonylcarbamoyladenylate synthase
LREVWAAVASGPERAVRDASDTNDGSDASDASDMRRVSPGMDERHYAPRAPLRVMNTANEALAAASALGACGARAGVVTCGAGGSDRAPGGVLVRDLPADAAGYARALYATLHALDAEGVAAIFVQRVPADDAWCAVADRLSRAAAP